MGSEKIQLMKRKKLKKNGKDPLKRRGKNKPWSRKGGYRKAGRRKRKKPKERNGKERKEKEKKLKELEEIRKEKERKDKEDKERLKQEEAKHSLKEKIGSLGVENIQKMLMETLAEKKGTG